MVANSGALPGPISFCWKRSAIYPRRTLWTKSVRVENQATAHFFWPPTCRGLHWKYYRRTNGEQQLRAASRTNQKLPGLSAISHSLSANTNAVQASHLDRIGLALCSVTLVHAPGMGSSSRMRSEKRLLRCTRQIATCKQSLQVDLQHYGGRRPVLPCMEDSVRRPQRPGNQARAEARSWRNPPSHSPSRIAGHRRLCRNALAGQTEHLARCQSLCASHAFASSKNPSAFVQKLWMPSIPCGSSWKMRTVPVMDLASVAAGALARRLFASLTQESDGMILRNKFHYLHAAAGYRCITLRRNPCARCTNPVRGKNMNGQCPSTTCIPFCLQNATASSLTAPVPPAR